MTAAGSALRDSSSLFEQRRTKENVDCRIAAGTVPVHHGISVGFASGTARHTCEPPRGALRRAMRLHGGSSRIDVWENVD